jgi:Ca2+:H+ antiporter
MALVSCQTHPALLPQLLFGVPKERPWTNVLLLLIPITLCSHLQQWPAGLTFCLALAALVPLAERLGFCTEALAEYTSDTLAGLVNATMGNAPELLIALFALRSSNLRIVQISLFGSIVSNLLLVLGVSLTVGGLKHREQSFSTVNSTNSIALLLVSISCHLFASVIEESHKGIYATAVLSMSRAFAVIGILLYIALLVFQLRTHAELFADEESEDEELGNAVKDATANGATTDVDTHPSSGADAPPPTPPSVSAAVPTGADDTEVTALAAHCNARKEDDNVPKMSFTEALVSLAVVAGIVSLVSEILTSSLKGAATDFKLSEGFVEAILTPIAGNATEHWSAVYFAHKNRLNISFGIAVGSSVQIALFLIPFM